MKIENCENIKINEKFLKFSKVRKTFLKIKIFVGKIFQNLRTLRENSVYPKTTFRTLVLRINFQKSFKDFKKLYVILIILENI